LNSTELLERAVALGASDLHISTGAQAVYRVNGRLVAEGDRLTVSETELFVRSIMSERQWEDFSLAGEVDFPLSTHFTRFRVNAYRQRGSCSAALRLIPPGIRSIEELGLPGSLNDLCSLQRGLVLVTGPTGSGKSTTLAAMIDLVNSTRDCHIMTLEDPIEYLHKHKRSLVNQREIGSDTQSYASGLRAVLRQDPDVILIGEMRDLESIAIALTAAETGHLVFSTLHTIGAAKTLDRVIDVFPPHQQSQIRIQLSMALQSVVSQQLLPTADGRGRVVAVEVMLATPAIRNLIREGKTPQINNAILTSGNAGMQTMDSALAALYKSGKISLEDCITFCVEQENMRRLLNMR
jgi:twitching motility protein PilT